MKTEVVVEVVRPPRTIDRTNLLEKMMELMVANQAYTGTTRGTPGRTWAYSSI